MNQAQIEAALGPLLEAEGPLPADWSRQLEAFIHMLVERNERVNLVSRASIDRVVETQLQPSLAAVLVVPPGEALRVLDLGSGGGFPAIPLKIVRPDIRVDLVESTRKKCEFLQDAVRELGLTECEVHWGRIEEPPPGLAPRAPFDRLTARAMGSPKIVQKAAQKWIEPPGSAWAFSAPEEADPGHRWPREAPVTGLRRLDVEP